MAPTLPSLPRFVRASIFTLATIAVPLVLVGLARAPQAAKPATAATPAADSSTYRIDDTHSMAIFRVQHMGAGAFWGMFNDLDGTVTYTPDSSIALDVTIDTGSVDSNNPKLDQHLKSPDFFNAKEFPAMTFKSTSAKSLGGGKFDVTGDLTIRGVTKSVTVPVACLGSGDMGMGTRAGFEAEFTINRADYGVSYGVEKGAVANSTRIIVAIEGVSTAKP